jgi:hypothetical protein
VLLRPIGLDTLATEVWKLTSLGAYSRGRRRRARVLPAISAPFAAALTALSESAPTVPVRGSLLAVGPGMVKDGGRPRPGAYG